MTLLGSYANELSKVVNITTNRGEGGGGGGGGGREGTR